MSSNFISKLKKKPALVAQNDLESYNKGIEQLKNIEDLFKSGSYQEAFKQIETLFNSMNNLENPIPLLLFDSLCLYLKLLIYQTKFDIIQTLLDKYNPLIDLIKSSKDKNIKNKYLNFISLITSIYVRQGQYKELENLLVEEKSGLSTVEDPNIIFKIKNHMAIKDIVNNKFKVGLDTLLTFDESHVNTIDDDHKIILKNNIGLAYLYSGDLAKSETYFKEALDLSLKSGNKIYESTITSNLGFYNLCIGNVNESSSYLENMLENYQRDDFNYELAITYVNLSSLSEIKGEIVQSQSDLTSAIDLANTLENKHLQFIINNNFANLAFVTGEFESAKNAYVECLEYFKANNLYFDSMIALFNLLSLSVLENDKDKEKQKLQSQKNEFYIQTMDEIRKSSDNDLFELIYNISRALDLKLNDRMVKKAEAQQIFTNIANSDTTIFNEFKVIALKNLSESLLDELSTSGDQEIIDELKDVLNKILEISEKENSLLLKVESYFIESKLALIDFKLNESRTLLSQAQTIAEEKGLTALAIFGSREYDNLLNQIAKYQDQSDDDLKNLSRNERLEIEELESMVNRIIRKRAEIPDIKIEDPFMFLMIATSGMSIFSKIFVDQDLMDEQLIGGFITAINIVTQQAFADQDAIEGIRHQDFTLLLKYLGSTRILCVYVFKGQTYFAMQKLKTFIETVQYSEAMPIIENADDIGMIISEEPVLLDIVTKIFEGSDDESLKLAKRNFFSQKISSTINHGLLLDDIPLFT